LCAVDDHPTPIALDSNETIFSMIAALNTCGYDMDLPISDPARLNVRAEIPKKPKRPGRTFASSIKPTRPTGTPTAASRHTFHWRFTSTGLRTSVREPKKKISRRMPMPSRFTAS